MSHQYDKKYFGDPQAGGNFDDAPFSLPPNAWVNMENCRVGSTDKGVVNTVESIGSTLMLDTATPSVTFLFNGGVEDTENNRFVYFLYNTTGVEHKIMCYYASTNTIYTVLLSSQVSGGLNLSKNSFIHSAKIVNGLLFWPDGTNNEPRCINIESGIKLNHPTFSTTAQPYVSPLAFSEITLIKPPPIFAPNIVKAYDSTFDNNFIANESFEYAYQYIFYDNQETVVGAYSNATRLNKDGETSNYVAVTMDSRETIPGTVRIVNLIVRIGNGEETGGRNAAVVKSWDKNVTTEAAEIANHNSSVLPLTYNFYNNIRGNTIAPSIVLKQNDTVPIYAQTCEAFRNRIGLANLVSGYNTPTKTSLSYSLTTTDISASVSIHRTLLEVRAYIGVPGVGNDYAYGAWYVYLDGTAGVTPGYYYLNGTQKTQVGQGIYSIYPILDPPPTSTTMAALTYAGATYGAIMDYVVSLAPPGSDDEHSQFYQRSNTITITGLSSAVYDIFKSKGLYKIGVQFYDYAMRPVGGVVTSDALEAAIPLRDYAYTNAVNGLVWSLSNTDAVNEIPNGAYYYSVVRTLNLRTRFFIQFLDVAAKYATKDSNGVYQFTSNIYTTGAVGVGINTTAMRKPGLGYVFTEGDIAVLVDETDNVYELPIIGQDGNYIILKAADLGNLQARKFVVEAYTPYQPSEQEPYYMIGEVYRVLDPNTNARRYENTTAVMLPDAYVLTRDFNVDSYTAEAMCPNDLFYKRWDNDGGKISFVTKLGRAYKRTYGVYSDTYIPDTAVNGLSSFNFDQEFSVPQDCGPIQKLILASKVEGQGTVMLAICTNETNSIYLGETRIIDASGQTQFLGTSQSPIGTIQTLKGSFGTINPESVVSFKGNIYWYDAINGAVPQYASNGLFDLAMYKARRFWNLFSNQYMSMTTDQIEALGSRPYVFATVDTHHYELLFTVPKLLSTPPKGYLVDYPSTVYPFDIYDGQGKTMVFDLKANPNHWQGSYNITSEGWITLLNKLYSFKNGHLYVHNQTTSYNNFYGTTYKSRVMFVGNQPPNLVKAFKTIMVEANMAPTLTYFLNDDPYLQVSDLMDFDYKNKEGKLYATIYRNKIVPSATGMTLDGLLTAEQLRGSVLNVMLEFTVGTTPLELRFVTIGFDLSRGQTI